MRLKNIRRVGRFRHKESGKQVNIHQGDRHGRCGTYYFYLNIGKRQFLSNYEISKEWEKVND